MDIEVGGTGELHAVVTPADTAAALGSGSLPVLATPRLLAWCEAATCRALDGRLPAGSSTVGTAVRLDHLAPSAVGDLVEVRAVLTDADGRRFRFAVEAVDAARGVTLGRGTVERVAVDDARFLARVSQRA